METKQCTKCNETKSLCDFGKQTRKKENGKVYLYFKSLCKPCESKRVKDYNKSNKDKVTAASKRYRENNLELCRKKERAYINSEKGRTNNRNRHRMYRANLSEAYIKNTIYNTLKHSKQWEHVDWNNIPKELIELQTKQLKLYRDVKNYKEK